MTSVWKQPKTDWKIEYDENGDYIGDYFEVADYNRIKNNLAYLKELTELLYNTLPEYIDLGEDVTYGSAEPTASLMKKIQDDLKIINDFTVNVDIGTAASFKSNTAGYLKDELNRIEERSLLLYILLYGQKENKPKLALRLGHRKDVL